MNLTKFSHFFQAFFWLYLAKINYNSKLLQLFDRPIKRSPCGLHVIKLKSVCQTTLPTSHLRPGEINHQNTIHCKTLCHTEGLFN